MNKATQILKLSQLYIKKALFPHLLNKYTITKIAETNLLEESERFDIKDEELFNQFESFMDAYKELLESLQIDPNNLESENLSDSAELIDTLNTRYSRIMNNPYLNMDSEEGYEEDFNPGELTSFIQKVVSDAEDKLKSIAGEDIDIGELRAAQFAKEFNELQEKHEEGKKEEWSAKKVQQALENRKKYVSELIFIKKVGKSHPNYYRYEKYIESRKNSYLSIMQDPARKESYRMKSKERQAKFQKKLKARKEELILLITQTTDPNKVKPLQEELNKIENELKKKFDAYQNKKTIPIKEQRDKRDFAGLLISFQQNLPSIKKEIKKPIIKKLLDQEYTKFQIYLDKIASAKNIGNTELLNMAIKELQKAGSAEAEQDPTVQSYIQNASFYYNYLEFLKNINKSDVMNSSSPLDDLIKQGLVDAINAGEALINNPGNKRVFRSTNNIIKELLEKIQTRINQ